MISYGIRGPSAVALKFSCTSGELVVVIVTGCGEENEPLGKVTVASPFRLIVPPSGGIVFVTDGNGRFAGGCRLCVALVQPKPINSRTERSNKYIRRTAASPSPRNRGYLSEARSARTSSVDLHSTLSDSRKLLLGADCQGLKIVSSEPLASAFERSKPLPEKAGWPVFPLMFSCLDNLLR